MPKMTEWNIENDPHVLTFLGRQLAIIFTRDCEEKQDECCVEIHNNLMAIAKKYNYI